MHDHKVAPTRTVALTPLRNSRQCQEEPQEQEAELRNTLSTHRSSISLEQHSCYPGGTRGFRSLFAAWGCGGKTKKAVREDLESKSSLPTSFACHSMIYHSHRPRGGVPMAIVIPSCVHSRISSPACHRATSVLYECFGIGLQSPGSGLWAPLTNTPSSRKKKEAQECYAISPAVSNSLKV